jgi:YfiH family protein
MPAEPDADPGGRAVLAAALRPAWEAPAHVTALMSSRQGGVSARPFDSLNLRPPQLGGEPVDDAMAVAENQRRFALALGAVPVYLDQVHGADVARLGPQDLTSGQPIHRADASVTSTPGLACTVLVADCLPVLLCSRNGRAVGAAHAGWRGLAAGVVEHTVQAVCDLADCAPAEVMAWLGACIGPRQFEVGADVLLAFGADPQAPDESRFVARARTDGQMRWMANLPQLARDRLTCCGVTEVSGGSWCTVEDSSRFFSFRRDRHTGRLAAAIALRA